jgi:clan AA aspartic protease
VILGSVANSEAMVEVEVSNFEGNSRRIEFVVDTGYNGDLTLPAAVIASLDLPSAGPRRARLADGGEIILQSFAAVIDWHGNSMRVVASQSEGKALLGMALLANCRLTIDVVDRGKVSIEPSRKQDA